jgi:ubiquinone/menaquinone biosynthesis C-methylase UbiE
VTRTWLPILLLVGAVLYWLLVLTEGAYLGKRVVAALYDWGAASYDRIKNVQPSDDAVFLARPLLSALKGLQVPLVLDVATGTGRLPLALLRQWGFEGRVVGLDLSERMLAMARCRSCDQRHRLGLIRQDAMVLPFADNSFHAVTCIEALEFLPRPLKALEEMVRVLRPGGQLLISNRVGTDALFLPGRAYTLRVLEERMRVLGLGEVRQRAWQVHYDLLQAHKPAGDNPTRIRLRKLQSTDLSQMAK